MTNKILRGIKNPSKAVEYISKKAGRRFIYNLYDNPTNPFAEDWDNLIILDACRFDTFSELNTLPGELEYRISPASGTLEWLREVLGESDHHDTVYVTANPRVSRYDDEFYKVIPAWKTHWNNELNVTMPSDLLDVTLQASEDFQDKRIVSHFMQPHIPFIGEFGREQVGTYDGVTKGRDRALGKDYSPNEEPYTLLKEGECDQDTIKRAYRENLEITLEVVNELIRKLDGKTVVTSDHGEMFGEVGWPIPRRRYGHPLHTAALNLQKVPWLVHESGKRRKINRGTPRNGQNIKDENIQDRLKHLGYK